MGLCRLLSVYEHFVRLYTMDLKEELYMVSYEPLWETMKARGVTTYTLIEKQRIPSKTIYNLKHNKNITTATIENLCNILKCTPNDVFTFYTPAIDAGEE